MTNVELVFRSVGERTSDLALELAERHVRPKRVHVLRDVRPFTETVRRMLELRHDADFVVYVDADCLIMQDMVPFLEANARPYVDCYVSDRFHGRIHCGVHVTRIDVVRAMARTMVPADDRAFVLRPESRTRNLAMRALGVEKHFHNFHILHDYFQWYRDVFHKYALRELKSRNEYRRAKLDGVAAAWDREPDELDYVVARRAIAHARAAVPVDASAAAMDDYVRALPDVAAAELERLGIPEKEPFARAELDAWVRAHPHRAHWARSRPRVFGIGLSRTGTRSLNTALQILGFDSVHYPRDDETYEDLASANYDFRILRQYDGITDITVAPYYAQLDQIFPGAKFILTVRDRESWLGSCRNHWFRRPAYEAFDSPERETHLKIRRLLRGAAYGCYEFDPQRFSWVYERHLHDVREHFRGRPESLLVLDICGGEGWEKLCPFLDRPIPVQPFPKKGRRLTEKLMGLDRDSTRTRSSSEPPPSTPDSEARA